ncbi:MAG: hypothetical protein CO129_06040 [Ignavibacteriales bacterium CG_4_9_14_3_um_filter_34_10]|nr:MAG: hypothetical protein CO129_06040 [Ignavibacteriales bacterium CG_4_9_14_3_um_filter_34_10]
MSTISVISFTIFSLLLLSFLYKKIDLLSPARLFILVWSFAIGLTHLKLSVFQKEWTLYSWVMLMLTLLSFLSGLFIIYVLNADKNVKTIKEMRLIMSKESIDKDFLFKILIIAFVLYLVSYLVSFLVMGFIPAFSPRPEIRTQWTGVFGVGLITHALPPILFYSSIYFFYEKKSKSKRTIVFLIATLTFFLNLLVLHRFDIVYWLVVLMVFMLYATEKLKFRYIFFFTLFLIAVVYGISTFRASKFIANIIYYTSGMKFSVKYAIFTEPYMYFAMNVENFINGVEKYSKFTYGYFTFNPILSLIQLKHPWEEYSMIAKFPHLLTSNYNTYTMFFEWYRDYGIFGLGFIPFIWGLIIGSTFYNLKRNPSLSSIVIYGAFLFVIVFSFFVNMLGWLHFIFNMSMLYLIAKLITRKNNYVKSE